MVLAFVAPVLLAAAPLLSLFAENESELELSVIWWPLALATLAALAVTGLFWLVTRSPAKAGALASLVMLWFFYFGPLADKLGIGDWWFLALWTLLLVVTCVAILRTGRELRNLSIILAVGAAGLALPQAVRVAAYQLNHPSLAADDPRLWPTRLQPPQPASGAARPDIYVLLPDDFARQDVLRHYFRYDDTAFRRALQQRGFVLAPQNRSPYGDSESNMAAELNLDYLSRFPHVLGKDSQDVRPVKRVMEDNRAARLLKPLGYRYVHLDTDDVTYAGYNPDISMLGPPDGFPNLWMRKSVLRLLGSPIGFSQTATDERFRDSIRSVFSKLSAVPAQPGPKFVVFHTLLPHDPYVFGARGQSVTFPGKTDESLATARGRAYYVHQLQDTERRLLAAIDRIRAGSKSPPLIVLQADEGFQANSEPLGEAAMQDIRVKGLLALHLPGGRSQLPEPPTTVNTLRFVLNRYLGSQYPMLRAASYPEGDLPYDFKEFRVK